MVKPERQFLVDAAFIVERTSQTFFGTPLLTRDAKDHTFTFGFVRDVLRIRWDLGMRSCVLVIGKEAYSHTTTKHIEDLSAILRGLSLHYICDRANSGLNLVGALHPKFSHVVTADKRLLQLSKEDFTIVLPRQSNPCVYDWLSPEGIRAAMGIDPKRVPAYLSLAAGSKSRSLTRRQAVGLIKAYGDLDSIFQNLASVASEQIRQKLQENEGTIRELYAKGTVGAVQSLACNTFQYSSSADLDTESNRQFLRDYGFHSLVRLLGDSPDAPF